MIEDLDFVEINSIIIQEKSTSIQIYLDNFVRDFVIEIYSKNNLICFIDMIVYLIIL